jgi:hypothetical protein
MNQIRLNQNGSISFKGQTTEKDPLLFLGFQVELDTGYTLRSFFMMLETYPLLSRLNPFSSSYMDQYQACSKKKCICEGVDYIELGKTVEMTGFPGEPSMEIYSTFKGAGSGNTVDIRSYWFDNLLDLNVKLGKLKHVVFGDTVETFEFQTVYNLFELIDGILWALSFHNMPSACRIKLL